MSKARLFAKHFSYNTLATLLSMAIQIFVILVVAKFVGPRPFGYWQLYVFYATYCGILHAGWCDGLYLIFAGYRREDLPWTWLKKNSLHYFTVELLLSLAIAIWALLTKEGPVLLVALALALTVLVSNVRNYLFSLMQATNHLLVFAKTNILDRLIYLMVMIFCLLSGVRSLWLLLGADLLSRSISLGYAYLKFYRPGLACLRRKQKQVVIKEGLAFLQGERVKSNEKTETESLVQLDLSPRTVFHAGGALLLANLAGGLYIGVVRYFIQRNYSIESFGRLSLMISMANLVIFFVNGVSVIVFPFLKTVKADQLRANYQSLKRLFVFATAFLLLGYFPIRLVISYWLPHYGEVMPLFAFVYPLFVFEGQLALLTNSYLKAYREEVAMLKWNGMLLILTILWTYCSLQLGRNLWMTFGGLLMVYMIRLFGSEWLLNRQLRLTLWPDNLRQLAILLVYLILANSLSVGLGFILYSLGLVGLAVLIRGEIKQNIRDISFEEKSEEERSKHGSI